MAKKSINIGRFILQIALGLFLALGGIWALNGGGDEAARWLSKQSDVLKIIFGVVELLAGIFLIVELFVGDKIGKVTKILNWVIIIIFAVIIVISDLLNGSWNKDFLNAAYNLSKNLVFLGGMWYLND